MRVYPLIPHKWVFNITLVPALERLADIVDNAPDGISIEELATQTGRSAQEVGMHIKVLSQKRLVYTDENVEESGQTKLDMFSDKIQSYAHNQRMGILRVKNGKQLGALYFDNGRLLDVKYKGLSGEEAFYRLFEEADDMAYSFLPGLFPEYVKPVIGKELQFLIMEAIRRRDEKKKTALGKIKFSSKE